MAVYTKINKKDLSSINKKFNLENFIKDLKKKFTVSIDEVEIIKENVVFKVPKKLN